MIEFSNFYQLIAKNELAAWLNMLPAQLTQWHRETQTEPFKLWNKALEHLPQLTPTSLDLTHGVTAEIAPALSTRQQQGIETLLRTMMPWRKGPFSLYGIEIDTEWRSDWKWQRILPHISNLQDRLVLDVGCGSGYHLWRMLGEGARLAVGIEPMPLYLCQFEAMRKLLGNDQRVHVLPLMMEQLPASEVFDSVFSMGVLYHQRSPLDHLLQLKKQLVIGGELILETLVILGDEQQILLPQDRYAQMRNVYFLPSISALQCWLQRCGFHSIRMVDMDQTSTAEQRRTSWMVYDSLADFLDPENSNRTIEGYPAPLRAVFVAEK